MKVVILAGGYGTRITEESHLRPKPMIEIGEKPILWHIMMLYSSYGFNDFIICAGYKQYVIKEYFNNYFLHNSDMTFDMASGSVLIHHKNVEPWKVTIVDTGLGTMTGGRVKRIQEYIGNEPFMLTYGDAVGDINIKELLECHQKAKKIGTISCYNFGQTKGVIDVNKKGMITGFREKSDLDGDLINIGFMVMEPEIFDLIEGDKVSFEDYPIKALVKNGQLNAYVHTGFWQCMDTMREKEKLEEIWNSGKAPWKVWKD